ncbi:MAG: Mur ligase domain-containing protein [Minisyncoccales bacterium]|jgi:UDP-N-acetylmuramate--alanine ligase
MKIHFIGIGGIGVSSLAFYFLNRGDSITGSDLKESDITRSLEKFGAKIIIGNHSPKNITKEVDLVIHTPAIKEDNPEIKKAKKNNIRTESYPEALGRLTKDYFTIAVSGTHGKSTTTAMLSLILIEAGLDPTVIIGTKLKEFGNLNFRPGKSKYLLIEADEYKRSFLNYNPKLIVVTNIEEDHLDYYKDRNEIIKSFKAFFSRLDKGGKIIANYDDPGVVDALKRTKGVIYYDQSDSIAKEIRKILKVPGEHNVLNALAAYNAANLLGISKTKTLSALSKFKGSWRRFEVHKSGYKGITLISDYAHHPTEVEKTLKAIRDRYPKKRIISFFQPHQYERTKHFFKEFVKVFAEAPVDKVIFLEIYKVTGREGRVVCDKINSKKMAEAVGKESVYKKELSDANLYLKRILKKRDVLIFMGAGDINNLFISTKKYLLDKKNKEKDNQ